MKKFLLLAGVACLFTANAQAAGVQLNQYVSGKVSYDWNRDKIKNVFDGVSHHTKLTDENYASHVAYGVQAGFVRGELEVNNSMPLSAKSTATDGTDLKMKVYKYSAMANAYFDFLNCTSWTPYVGAGLGTSWLKAKQFAYADGAKTKNFDKSVYNLAYQAMAGVAYKINSHWTVDAGYRFADLGRIRKHEVTGQNVKLKVRDHSALLGVRYTF
ncbi:MAG: porin family protein [Alphaproteobacteria bacterium]|nr:porin family protein [Alphaproteobacteria bacterium]